MNANCIDCGAPFWRKAGDEWKVRCLSCWAKHKKNATPRTPACVRDELPHHIRSLLQLAHPDKHNGSPLAIQITQWLLRLKKELRI